MPLITQDVGAFFGQKISFDAAEALKKSALAPGLYMRLSYN